MEIRIRTLAEHNIFWAVLANALNFKPSGTFDVSQRLMLKPKEAEEYKKTALKTPDLHISIERLFSTMPYIKKEGKAVGTYLATMQNNIILSGLDLVTRLVVAKTDITLVDSPEMRSDLEILRRNSPPLYERVKDRLRAEDA